MYSLDELKVILKECEDIWNSQNPDLTPPFTAHDFIDYIEQRINLDSLLDNFKKGIKKK